MRSASLKALVAGPAFFPCNSNETRSALTGARTPAAPPTDGPTWGPRYSHAMLDKDKLDHAVLLVREEACG